MSDRVVLPFKPKRRAQPRLVPVANVRSVSEQDGLRILLHAYLLRLPEPEACRGLIMVVTEHLSDSLGRDDVALFLEELAKFYRRSPLGAA